MKRVRKNWDLIAVTIAVLLLDFAALDDITTGNEPSYVLEYSILGISVFVFITLAMVYRKRIQL